MDSEPNVASSNEGQVGWGHSGDSPPRFSVSGSGILRKDCIPHPLSLSSMRAESCAQPLVPAFPRHRVHCPHGAFGLGVVPSARWRSSSKLSLDRSNRPNYAKKKPAHHVCTNITFKRIELEDPGWSGFEFDHPGLSCSICLEVVMKRSWYMKLSVLFN